jgi:aldehyde dehydrogenase (NAD+)
MRHESKETPVLMFPSHIQTVNEPLGLTLIIGSWNYPFGTIFPAFISAIAAGNPCIIKPSEKSPFSSQIVEKIVSQMDQRYFRCFQGAIETSVYLNKLKFDHIIFTGSSRTGKFIRNDAPINTKVTLELGGVNHSVVDVGANLE